MYLREDHLQIFKTWNVDELDEPDIANTAVALLTTVSENTTGPIDFSPASIAIVVEDDIVVSDLHEMADAFVLLFGLMYALHLDYPKKLMHTFTFTQTVIMGLDEGKPLKPCLLNLKNHLFLKH
ncbi:hypothetical protein LDENG_00205070 [Lucifuga dentata]|nr:hypothetical protein LDENG_00205070 [Lucifuga dentata]